MTNKQALAEAVPEFRNISPYGVPMVVIALIWVALMGALSWVALDNIRRDTEKQLRGTLLTVLNSTHGLINEWVKENTRDLINLARNTEFHNAAGILIQENYSGYSMTSQATAEPLARLIKNNFGDKNNRRFMLTTGDGGWLYSLDDGRLAQRAPADPEDEFIPRVLSGNFAGAARRHWYFEERSEEHGAKPQGVFLFGVSIKSREGAVIGSLVMGVNLEEDMTRLAMLGKIGDTGESYAFDREGMMLTDSRYDHHLSQSGLLQPGENAIYKILLKEPGENAGWSKTTKAEIDKLPLTYMAQKALKGLSGDNIKGYRDYRGVMVAGAWLWDEELGLGLATEQDMDEAFAAYRLTHWIIFIVIGAAGAMTLLLYLILLGGGRQVSMLAQTALYANELLRKEAQLRENAQEEHRKSEKRLQSLMDNTTSVIYMKDSKGHYVHVNKRFLRIFRLTAEQVVGKSDFDIFPKKIAATLRANDLTVLNTGSLLEIEETAQSSGQDRVYLSVKYPIYGEDGKLLGVGGISTDITERKMAETSARESERRFRRMLENVNLVSVMLDSGGNVTFANDFLLKLTGYSWEEVIGRNWFDQFIPEEARGDLKAIFAKIIAGESVSEKNHENEIMTRSGGKRLITWSNTELFDAQGRIIGTASIGVNVTEQRKTIQALAASERRFQDIAQNSGDWIWEVDSQGKFTYSSAMAEQIIGYKPEELIGRRFWEFMAPDEAKTQEENFLDPSAVQRPFVNMPNTLIHKNGSTILAEANGIPIIDLDEGFLGFRGASRNVTERIQAERRLKESQEGLAKAQTIAHIGNWDWNISTNELKWSDEIYRIFGLQPQEFGATYDAFLERIHPEDRERVAKAVDECVKEDKPYFIEHRVVRPDGSIRAVTEQGEVYRDFDGYPLRMVGVVADITERKEAERALIESRQSLERAQKVAKIGSWEMNLITNEVKWSEQIDEIYGFDKSSPQNMDKFWKVVYPDDIPLVENNIREAMNGEKAVTVDYRVVHPDGKIHVVHSTAEVFLGPDGRPERMLGVAQDITERKKAEEQLHLAAKVFDSSLDGIMVVGGVGNITSVNRAFCDITGFSENEAIGRDIGLIAAAPRNGEQGWGISKIWESVKAEGSFKGEIWCRKKSGREFPVWMHINSIKGRDGAGEQYVAIFHDITESKEKEKEIAYQAYYDSLTGLPNRLLFQDRLKMAVARAKREDEIFALMFLDLDNFKNVNDSLGHDVGDLLLKGVSVRLAEALREIDTVARIGGDEFVILLERLKDQNEAARVARKIIKSLNKSFSFQDKPLYASGSLGITIFPQDGDNTDALLKNADIAMYKAKELGKGGFQLFTPDMNEKFSKRLAMENNLREAMENDAFVVHYQPKLDLASGAITGMEALARWIRPDGAIVSPSDFIPVAEETGLILRIGEMVLRKSLRKLARINQELGCRMKISVNLSARQFAQGNVVDTVSSALRDHAVEPDLLELEITESSVMLDVGKAMEKMKELKKLGIQLSIDDFGTGFSSLNYLRQFPIDVLKIDRSFVMNMKNGDADAAIVDSIIAIARNLGLKVVAEGVETELQLSILRKLGCDEAQGYLISRPVSESDITHVVSGMLKKRAIA